MHSYKALFNQTVKAWLFPHVDGLFNNFVADPLFWLALEAGPARDLSGAKSYFYASAEGRNFLRSRR